MHYGLNRGLNTLSTFKPWNKFSEHLAGAILKKNKCNFYNI